MERQEVSLEESCKESQQSSRQACVRADSLNLNSETQLETVKSFGE